jgi:hypothetical protein
MAYCDFSVIGIPRDTEDFSRKVTCFRGELHFKFQVVCRMLI